MRAEKRICRNTNGPLIAALSKYVKEQFKKHYDLDGERMVLIPNGVKVDDDDDTKSAQKLRVWIYDQLAIKSSAHPVLLLFGANNFRLKGLNVLMEALALLTSSQTTRPTYLIVAGGGAINKYRRVAQKLRLDKNVLFLGHVKNIQNVLSISDVAVLPTFYDPCSRFILEALAANKPVITTKFNGATDMFVNNRHGKVIDKPEDISALAQAVAYFRDTNNIKKASQAIVEDNLKEKISISRVAEQLISTYKSILEKRR